MATNLAVDPDLLEDAFEIGGEDSSSASVTCGKAPTGSSMS